MIYKCKLIQRIVIIILINKKYLNELNNRSTKEFYCKN